MLKHLLDGLVPFGVAPPLPPLDCGHPKARKRGRLRTERELFHVMAYSQLFGAAQTNGDTTFVSDLGVVPTFNNHALLPWSGRLVFAAAMGATLSRARFDSGQLRVLGNMHIFPIIPAAIPGTNPNVDWMVKQPVQLPQREEIAVQLTNTAAEQDTVVVGVSQQVDPWPSGNIWIVRATSTTATVANKWTNIGQPTMETALPVGTYSILWSDAQSANGQAHRYIFPPAGGPRPGFLSLTSITNRNPPEYYMGWLGNLGYFVNDVLPFIEILANAADAAFEFRWAVVRTQASIGSMVGTGPLGIAGP